MMLKHLHIPLYIHLSIVCYHDQLKLIVSYLILINNSYSLYSNFKVAANVEAEDEKVYQGVNIENASFGATICAERSAVSPCISSGNTSIKNVYLLTAMGRFIYPCEICLQFISKFLDSNG